MSRQVPTVRRKEIIYRRSFVDQHNDRFDQEFENNFAPVRRAEAPQTVYIAQNKPSDTHEQLSNINQKLDSILQHLNGATPKKTEKSRKNQWDDQLARIQEICDRLEKLENVKDKTLKVVPSAGDFIEILAKINQLSNEQELLKDKVNGINSLGSDSIDELLSVINDTRRDLEEKIANIKQLSDGNWIHLDNKMDEFQHNQQGIQVQINELMHILTNLSSTRASSVNEKAGNLSRSSSKSSSILKSLAVPPNAHSPTPFSNRSTSGSDRVKSRKAESVKSHNSLASSTKLEAPIPETKKAPSVELLYRQKSVEHIPLALGLSQKSPITSRKTSSSGSFIAPLHIDERRNSQPANIFHNSLQKV